jgi:hypothetical protein
MDTTPLQDRYERRGPHAQNAVDLFQEWTCAFPEQLGVEAGYWPLYADPRIAWAVERLGSLEGQSVLELGPLEGAHSYMLEQLGAESVLAIEANKQAFLKCLVTKELLGLQRCRFLLGDFERYLEETDQSFDVVLASGVLYHMQNPVQVLELMARRSNTLILWTHYFDGEVLHASDQRRIPFAAEPTVLEHAGHRFTLHARTYLSAWKAESYCGGPDDTHYWMERPDILAFGESLGFDDIEIAFEDTEGANGPSCLFLMRRSQPVDQG